VEPISQNGGSTGEDVRDPGQSEEELIGKAKSGDRAAFHELVLRYQEQAFRAAFLVLRDTGEADDAAQEAFIKAHAALPRFREDRPFRPWILKITVNQAPTMLKKRRRHAEVPLDGSAETAGTGIDEAVMKRELANKLTSALNELKVGDRTIIYLRYFLNLSEKELAAYLSCPAGTVKSRLHRAVTKLGEVVRKRHPQLLKDER
jgi:RNA polymerase sigma-70 factor (ECF subfamily)